MKENFTRIAVILDRSGSMSMARESAIAGFNAFVEQQKKLPGTAKLTLAQFNAHYEVTFDKDLQEVPTLTWEMFSPNGMTALLDAQGRTIAKLGLELAALPESERPTKVIILTLTDGLENASTDYNLSKIASMVKEQREKYGWEFIYIGANQDAIKVGSDMGIPVSASMNYNVSDPAAVRNTMSAASSYVGLTRSLKVGETAAGFSLQDRKSAVGKK